MYANEKKIYTLFLFWLIISLILVFLIIIVGGLTRLTDSGLSITEWELFSGLLPPINNDSWNLYFNEYKKIPQYKLLNFDITYLPANSNGSFCFWFGCRQNLPNMAYDG